MNADNKINADKNLFCYFARLAFASFCAIFSYLNLPQLPRHATTSTNAINLRVEIAN